MIEKKHLFVIAGPGIGSDCKIFAGCYYNAYMNEVNKEIWMPHLFNIPNSNTSH